MAMGARFSRTAPDSFFADGGATHRGLSVSLKEELLETMEVGTGAEELVALESNFNSMAKDGSIEESSFASHAVRPGDLQAAMRPITHNSQHLGAPHHSLHSGYLVHPPPHNKSMAVQGSFCRGQESGRSAQATHFLDVCFLCSKRLGHGRDVFIYRGDRAFCSVECRHSQIVADEMREKCRVAAAKEGGTNTPSTNPTSTSQVETAAAA